MKIEQAKKEDINTLVNIEEEVFLKDSSALSKRAFSYHFKKNIIFKVIIDTEIVAYSLWLKRKTFYRLYSFAILKDYQGKGIGKALLEDNLKVLDKNIFELEVRLRNTQAINLYKKFSFQEIKILKNFYDDEDGIKMRLKR